MINPEAYIFAIRLDTDSVLNILNESSIPFVESEFSEMVFEPDRSAKVKEFTCDLRVQKAIESGLINIEIH